jgi:hypothetical protein
MNNFRGTIHPQRIEACIEALNIHLGGSSHAGEDITPLLQALRAVAQDPGNGALLARLSSAFNSLGASQGAVLTYAPYLSVILPHDLLDSLD